MEECQGQSHIMSNQKEFNWDNFSTKGFGDGYSKEQKADMEAMYALLDEQPDIADKPTAIALNVSQGEVQFDPSDLLG